MCQAAEHAKFRHAGTWQRAVPPIVSANISRERTPHPDDGDILAAFDCRMHYLARVASANGQQQSQNICRYGLQDNGRDQVTCRLQIPRHRPTLKHPRPSSTRIAETKTDLSSRVWHDHVIARLSAPTSTDLPIVRLCMDAGCSPRRFLHAPTIGSLKSRVMNTLLRRAE